MTSSVLLTALLAAVPARAQMRVAEPVILPGLGIAAPAFSPCVSAFALPTPPLNATLAPSLAAPSILFAAPALVQPVRVVAVTPAARLAALTAGVNKAAAALGDKPGADAAAGAGREIEALLTGAPVSAATPEEVSFVLGASRSLAERADELGSAKGLKAATMSGGDFIGLLEEARASAPQSPTPAAGAAAKEVAAQIVRVARALIPAEKPLKDSLPRALAVWQVFDQELAIAAEKGGIDTIVADAKLFASQVEASVDPAPKPAPLAAPAPHPEDPENYKSVSVEGSVFGWKPIAESPNHGFAPLDALIRRVLGEKKSPYAKGFDLPGAAARAGAAVFFYGERHTDGGLISENMKRLADDAKPGKPVIVLVEGYTDWALRGYAAVKYLADRGFDPDALAAKGIQNGDVEVRGWDTETNYSASKHPLLQHHMNLLALNHMAHGEERGWRYYLAFAKTALATVQGWRELWRAALIVRNGDLDRAVARAVDDAGASGATVHVIAGTDHLMQNPRLAGIPWLGRPALRRSLHAALGGRPYWAGQPANTLP